MSASPDILIIGGGVIGLTTAYFLAQEGVPVCLFERGEVGQQASWAGAGIIPSATVEHARTPYEHLRALSSRMYPSLSQQLLDQSGIDNGYHVCGGLEVPEPNGSFTDDDEWRSSGITFREIRGEELRGLEPGLIPTLQKAYFLPDLAQVRNPWHLKALTAACIRSGVQIETGAGVRGLVRQQERVVAVETERGRRSAGKFLLTAGAWTEELLQQVGWRPGIRPIRGQIALLNTGSAGVRPILMQGKRYLVPRGDGRILAGSTEEDAGFDARPTGGGVEDLLAFAVSLLPELKQAALERCWAGLRPGSPDGLPYLGKVPGCAGLYVGAGHFRAGLQLSPASGLVLKELLLDQPPSVPLQAFRLDRQG